MRLTCHLEGIGPATASSAGTTRSARRPKRQRTLDYADFVEIARAQQRLEDDAAIDTGPLLFCDTDAMTTALWYERYQGYRSAEIEELGRMRTYDLFVLCDIDIRGNAMRSVSVPTRVARCTSDSWRSHFAAPRAVDC